MKLISIDFEIGIQSKKDTGSLRQGMTLKTFLEILKGGITITLLRTLADTQSSYAMLKFTHTTSSNIYLRYAKDRAKGYTGWLL